MLKITGLNGTTLPLINTSQPERKRDIDGSDAVTFTVREDEINSKAFELIENEAKVTLEEDEYIIKNIIPSVVNDTAVYEVQTVHRFHHDLGTSWVYDEIEGRKVITLNQALTHLLPEGYTFSIYDNFDNITYENFGKDWSLALFEKIRVDYGFEYIKDGAHLAIYSQIGNKTAKQMRYKHNIKSIKGGLDSTNLATYIEGIGARDEETGEPLVSATYTSPLAETYGILHAKPIDDGRYHNELALLDYMKSKLHDTIDVSYEITYDEFIKALDDNTDVELGDSIYLVHEILRENFSTRIVSVIDYPLSGTLKPIYTIASKSESLINRLTRDNNKQKEVERTVNNVSNKVEDIGNIVEGIDAELERIENEVIPEIEQVVEDTKIPSQPEPPHPIPNSKLWWDTSQNPPRLMRWTGEEWVVLAPTEGEIDDLIEQVKEEAERESREYTDEEIEQARQAIINQIISQLDDVVEDYNEKIAEVITTVDGITTIVSGIDVKVDEHTEEIEEAKLQLSEIDVTVEGITSTVTDIEIDVEQAKQSISEIEQTAEGIISTVSSIETEIDGLESNMTAMQSTIEQLPEQINLAVTEGIEGINIGGTNLIHNTDFSLEENVDELYSWLSYISSVRQETVNNYHFARVGVTSAVEVGDNPRIRTAYKYHFKPNQEYTFSMIGFSSDRIDDDFTQVGIYVDGLTRHRFDFEKKQIDTISYQDLNRNLYKYTYTFTFDGDKEEECAIFIGSRAKVANSAFFCFGEIKLEEGNKSTDWSLSPEDAVTKSNVLSSINLSEEGVKIEGAKVDIKGLVSIINNDDSSETLIDGGRLINDSITTKQLNVDEIFANSAVIAKIQADSVLTAELDAGKITTGELDAGKVSIVNLSADSIVGGSIDAKDVNIYNLNASNINSGLMSFDYAQGGTLTLGGADDTHGRMQVLDDDGEVIADLDGEYGGFSRLLVGDLTVTDDIDAPYIVKETEGDITLHVYGDGGSDDNTGGSQNTTNGLYSIREAIRRLPKVINHDVVISLGYYYGMQENVTLSGFMGSGSITIRFTSKAVARLDGYIRVLNCDCRVVIEDGVINRSTGDTYIIDNQTSRYVYVNNMRLNGDGHTNGIRTWRGGQTYIIGTQAYNVGTCYTVNSLGRAYITNSTGRGDVRGIDAQNGSIIHRNSNGPYGVSTNARIGGSSQAIGSFSSIPDAPAQPKPPAPKTVTRSWTSSSSGSYSTTHSTWDSYHGNRVVQSSYNSSSVYRGFWFMGTGMRNTLNGKKIKRVRIRAQRRSSGGVSGNVPVRFRAHQYSSRPSGTPVLSGTNHSVNFKWGERKWVTLPSSFHSLLSGGSYYGLGIQASSNVNSQYAVMNAGLEIEVTYES